MDDKTFPLIYQSIEKYQHKDKEVIAKLKCTNYHTKYFRGGRIVTQLICKDNKNFIPPVLQKYAVNWYHTYLLYPVMDCSKASIGRHYFWPKLRYDIRIQIKYCRTYHINKKQILKYGHLPSKEAGFISWYILLVDIIGKYKIGREGHSEPLILKALTVTDPENGWFEIIQYKYKQAANIANLVDQTRLCRYPRPKIITSDRRNEFLVHAFKND